MTPNSTQLVTLAIAEIPGIAAALRSLFAQANPTAPVPTDAEIFAAYKDAFNSGIAKDNLWLAQHPGPGYSKVAAAVTPAPVIPSTPPVIGG